MEDLIFILQANNTLHQGAFGASPKINILIRLMNEQQYMLNYNGLQIATNGFAPKQHGVCWEWKIPENTVEAIAECPVSFQRDSGPRVCPFGAVLALPAGID